MPSFISKMGRWFPSKEKQYIPADPGKNIEEGYIYEGPDRAARAVLAEEGVEFLGTDARLDPEIIMRARQLGMTVDEFLKMHEPPSQATAEVERLKETQVETHKDIKPKKGVSHRIAGLPMEGGFGDAPADAPKV